jgi:hypothetical protein
MRQWIGKNVSDMLFSADMFNVHLPISNALSNEMKPDINMFTLIVEDGILTKGYS